MVFTLKSCNHGVLCLQPTFRFFLLKIVYRLHKLFSFVKIIIMNKICKSYKLLLVTELIFCNNLKTKVLLGFCGGIQGDHVLGWSTKVDHHCGALLVESMLRCPADQEAQPKSDVLIVPQSQNVNTQIKISLRIAYLVLSACQVRQEKIF